MHSRAFVVVALATAMAALSPSPVLAQGEFAGSWRVTELVRPDWIEHTSPEPVNPMKPGDVVTFRSGEVHAPGSFGCSEAKYEVRTLAPGELFEGSITEPEMHATMRDRFGFGPATRTLLVDCDKGAFQYQQGSKGLVVQFDNMIYVLEAMK